VRQRISDEPFTLHEGCGGEVERLISVPALQFKGKGWYVTDYGRGGVKPSSTEHDGSKPESKPEGPKTESRSTAKTESPPAPAKSPTK